MKGAARQGRGPGEGHIEGAQTVFRPPASPDNLMFWRVEPDSDSWQIANHPCRTEHLVLCKSGNRQCYSQVDQEARLQ